MKWHHRGSGAAAAVPMDIGITNMAGDQAMLIPLVPNMWHRRMHDPFNAFLFYGLERSDALHWRRIKGNMHCAHGSFVIDNGNNLVGLDAQSLHIIMYNDNININRRIYLY